MWLINPIHFAKRNEKQYYFSRIETFLTGKINPHTKFKCVPAQSFSTGMRFPHSKRVKEQIFDQVLAQVAKLSAMQAEYTER